MSLIIAGNFVTQADAQLAADQLQANGIDKNLVCTFAINPPGQHAGLAAGGDHAASHGATNAGKGAAAGAGIGGAVGLGVGLATSPVTGPATGPVAGAAIGAYVGSLAGALHHMQDENEVPSSDPAPSRPAGVMVAVNASQSTVEEQTIRLLRQCGAQQIERALGVWRDGAWDNFDPTSTPHLVDEPVRVE